MRPPANFSQEQAFTPLDVSDRQRTPPDALTPHCYPISTTVSEGRAYQPDRFRLLQENLPLVSALAWGFRKKCHRQGQGGGGGGEGRGAWSVGGAAPSASYTYSVIENLQIPWKLGTSKRTREKYIC